ncbi:hypothetical protein B0H13DRAFT_2358563 [Mycena leptocephala]|nr:hypothetical protein B0H13DRAFT_2358563 [Mycena leptocephala]
MSWEIQGPPCHIHRTNHIFEEGEEFGIVPNGFWDWVVGGGKADIATVKWRGDYCPQNMSEIPVGLAEIVQYRTRTALQGGRIRELQRTEDGRHKKKGDIRRVPVESLILDHAELDRLRIERDQRDADSVGHGYGFGSGSSDPDPDPGKPAPAPAGSPVSTGCRSKNASPAGMDVDVGAGVDEGQVQVQVLVVVVAVVVAERCKPHAGRQTQA